MVKSEKTAPFYSSHMDSNSGDWLENWLKKDVLKRIKIVFVFILIRNIID